MGMSQSKSSPLSLERGAGGELLWLEHQLTFIRNQDSFHTLRSCSVCILNSPRPANLRFACHPSLKREGNALHFRLQHRIVLFFAKMFIMLGNSRILECE